MKYCGGNKRAERKRQEAKEARALLRAAAREEAGFKSGQNFEETYATVKDHFQKVSVVCVCAWLCEQQERMRESARAKQKRDFIS